MRVIVRIVLGAGIAGFALAASATPVAAHGVGGVRPTNYETRVRSLRPAVPGIALHAVDVGDRLELENRTDRDVVVLGYDGEPYLRVGPRGAFENARSLATYVNRSREATEQVPADADPSAPPEWRRIGAEPIARWHDHRAHWMRADDPPAVRADRSSSHVVQRFRVEIVDGDRTITARGDVRWVPGPSPWPWIALAAVVAIALAAPGRTRVASVVVAVGLAAVVVVEAVHVVGAWDATTLGIGTRLGASAYALGAIAVAVLALVWIARRGLHAAAPLVLVAGLFVGIAGGLADLSVLTRSQLPTTLAAGVARAVVAFALGLGAGLTVAAAMRLRASTPTWRAGTPTPVAAMTSRGPEPARPSQGRNEIPMSGRVVGAVVTAAGAVLLVLDLVHRAREEG